MRFIHQTRKEDLQIEITPGVFAVLRGAEETWQAVEEGDVIYTECICCNTPIMCISDAEYVLCPECRVVSLLDGLSGRGAVAGVGLGLRANDYNGNRRDHRRHNYHRQHTDPGQFVWSISATKSNVRAASNLKTLPRASFLGDRSWTSLLPILALWVTLA